MRVVILKCILRSNRLSMTCTRNTMLIVAVALAVLLAPALSAHFGIVIPDKWMANVKDVVTIYYAFGHPFEHILMSTKEITIVDAKAYDPDGKAVPLSFAPVNGTHFSAKLRCEVDGDYVVLVVARAVHGAEVTVDYGKTVVHCGTEERGWSRVVNADAEIVLLTRPYGLEAPAVITGVVLSRGSPQADARVEVEEYHAVTPESLLKELERKFAYPDAYITKATLTGSSGEFYAVIPRPGIWLIGYELGEVPGVGLVRTSYTLFVDRPVTAWPPEADVSKAVSDLRSSVDQLSKKVEGLEARIARVSVPDWLVGATIASMVIAIIAIALAAAMARRR